MVSSNMSTINVGFRTKYAIILIPSQINKRHYTYLKNKVPLDMGLDL